MNEQLNNINTEEKDHSEISYRLPLGVGIMAFLLIFGLIYIKQPEYVYSLNTDEILVEALKQEAVLGPVLLTDIILNKDSAYQFVDLRTPHEFLKGHVPGAINIPVHALLDKENQKSLNQDEKILILYHENHPMACGPWMVLRQLGYKNIYLMNGGYTYYKNSFVNNFAPLSGDFSDERAKYDYSSVMQAAGSGKSASQTVVSGADAPVKKTTGGKKEKSGTSGGC